MRAHVIEGGKVVNTIEVVSIESMPGMTLVDADVGGQIGDLWDGEQFSAPPPTPKTRDELKADRAAAVAAIKVTVGGKSFDGDETSQTRMSRAIIGMQAASAPTITWTLADNSVADVTLSELTEALILAGQEQARLWVLPA